MKLNISKLIWTIVMAFIGILFILPFVWMLSTSFKPEMDVFKFPIEWIPKNWNAVENYQTVWSGQFVRYYWNSIYITIATTVINVFVCALAAYGFSKLRFRGREPLFLVYVLTMLMPFQVTLVPNSSWRINWGCSIVPEPSYCPEFSPLSASSCSGSTCCTSRTLISKRPR